MGKGGGMLETYWRRWAQGGRASLWLGGAALAFLLFFRVTRELIEGDVNSLDIGILHAVAARRTPWLTTAMVDVTALGSSTLVILFSCLAFLVLIVLRNRLAALQLLIASTGGALLTLVTKDMIERVRPPEAEQLVVVSGFSYPSGHSLGTCALYVTIAIIACQHVRDFRAKAAIFMAISSMVILVGASRVYLGVHYMTDVLSGISLGAAWALLLAGIFARTRGKPNRSPRHHGYR